MEPSSARPGPADQNASRPVCDTETRRRRTPRQEERLALDRQYRALLLQQFNGKFPVWTAVESLEHLEQHNPRLYELMYGDEA